MYIDRAQNFARIDIGLVYQAPLVVEVPGLDGSPMPQKIGTATTDLDPEMVRVRNGTAVLTSSSMPVPETHRSFRLSARMAGQSQIAGAVEEHSATLISLIDHLEFLLHKPLDIVSVSVCDVSPPLVIGERRECSSYASGGTVIGGRMLLVPNDMRWTISGEERCISLTDYHTVSVKVETARWWYLKAIATYYAVDRFIALWIALEILCTVDDVSVKQPVRLDCQHTLDQCPQCGKPTLRAVKGEALKEYLGKYGVENPDIKKMWQLRQVVHGKNLFGPADSKELTEQVGILQMVIFSGLKRHLGSAAEVAPTATPGGGPVIGWMAAGGNSEITAEDIALDTLQTASP